MHVVRKGIEATAKEAVTVADNAVAGKLWFKLEVATV